MTLFHLSAWTDQWCDVIGANEMAELHVSDKESLNGGVQVQSEPQTVYYRKRPKYTMRGVLERKKSVKRGRRVCPNLSFRTTGGPVLSNVEGSEGSRPSPAEAVFGQGTRSFARLSTCVFPDRRKQHHVPGGLDACGIMIISGALPFPPSSPYAPIDTNGTAAQANPTITIARDCTSQADKSSGLGTWHSIKKDDHAARTKDCYVRWSYHPL